MSELSVVSLGVVPFLEARQLQEQLILERRSSAMRDTLLVCQHPPTVTIGRRAKDAELGQTAEWWNAQGVSLERVTRGGSVTYHAPGQLVFYPIISLRERGWGVRTFVIGGLEVLAGVVRSFGLYAEARETPAGVWVVSASNDNGKPKKIAAVGLKIEHGITNHGFSLNVSCDLAPFTTIVPCGQPDAVVTSLVEEKCGAAAELQQQAMNRALRMFGDWLK